MKFDQSISFLENHPISKEACKATKMTFNELLNDLTINPEQGDHLFATTWPVTYSSRKISMKNLHDIQAFAILIWLHSNESFDEKFELHRIEADKYLLKLEYELGWVANQPTERGRSKGGINSGVTKQEIKKERQARVRELYLKSPREKRYRITPIADELKTDRTTIRKDLKEMGLL